MRKLPVLATTGRVYGFLWDEFGTIVRLSWLPLLIVAVISYFATLKLGGFFEIAEGRNLKPVVQDVPGILLKNLLAIVINLAGIAIVAVALHRVILFGDRRPGSFAYLSFGKVEGVFVVFPVIFAAIFFALMVAGMLVVATLWRQFGLAFFLLFVAVIAIIAFPLVRSSLVLPIAVLKRRFAFGESWNLTRGNFWRLLAVWLLAEAPLLLLLGIANRLLDPKPMILLQESGASLGNLSLLFFVDSIEGFVIALIGGALGVAVLSYSYKALTGQGPDEILTPQG